MTRLPILGIALVSAALPVMAATRVLATASRPVELGAGPTRVALVVPKGANLRAAAGRNVYVILQGLQTKLQPGVLYRLYLNLPEGAKPDAAHYIGMINFYDAAGTGQHEHPFEVTEKRALLDDEANTITIVPRGKPVKGSKTMIQRIELIAE